MRHPVWKYVLVTALVVAAALSMPLTTRQLALEYPPQTLRCVIDLKGEPVRGLTVGMNKIILREFADDHALKLEFITPADSADYLDSLLEGAVDLLVMYRADSNPAPQRLDRGDERERRHPEDGPELPAPRGHEPDVDQPL